MTAATWTAPYAAAVFFIKGVVKMKEINSKACKPVSIQADDIAALAQQGLERALAARQTMNELSEEQAKDVGGGAFVLSKAIIAGGPWGPYPGYLGGLGSLTLPGQQAQFG